MKTHEVLLGSRQPAPPYTELSNGHRTGDGAPATVATDIVTYDAPDPVGRTAGLTVANSVYTSPPSVPVPQVLTGASFAATSRAT